MATQKQIKYWNSMKGKSGNGFKKGHIGYTPIQTEEHKKKIGLATSISNKGKHFSLKTEFKKKQIPWNKDKEFTAIIGEKHFNWKGDKCSYSSMHIWVSKWKGKPKKCESCGIETAKKFEWANIDHQYRRVLEDYIRMCTTCHRRYDRDVLKIKMGR